MVDNQGLNVRKFHSFHTEDFIGRIKQCCAASKQQSLEHIAMMRWYTGFLASILHIFSNLCLDPGSFFK